MIFRNSAANEMKGGQVYMENNIIGAKLFNVGYN